MCCPCTWSRFVTVHEQGFAAGRTNRTDGSVDMECVADAADRSRSDRWEITAGRALPAEPSRLFELLSKPTALTVVRGPRAAGKTALLRTWRAQPVRLRRNVIEQDTPQPTSAEWLLGQGVPRNRAQHRARTILRSSSCSTISTTRRPGRSARALTLLESDERLHLVVTTRSPPPRPSSTSTMATWTGSRSPHGSAVHSRRIAGRPACPRNRPRATPLETVQTVTAAFRPSSRPPSRWPVRSGPTTRRAEHSPAAHSSAPSTGTSSARSSANPDLADLRQFMLTISAARIVPDEVAAVLAADGDAPQRVRALEAAGLLIRRRGRATRVAFPAADPRIPHARSAIGGAAGAAARVGRPGPLVPGLGELDPALARRRGPRLGTDGVDPQVHWVELVSRHFRLVRDRCWPFPPRWPPTTSRSSRAELFLRFGADSAGFAARDGPVVRHRRRRRPIYVRRHETLAVGPCSRSSCAWRVISNAPPR